ncbi:MAG: TRAP-type C4-dicarboxylate transport system, substrate-binding protein [Myxococcales bacterium]|nr:TRAP-type C4-dicarboxylate transport system, substrate-binding protein [Myxococcales bacterium]
MKRAALCLALPALCLVLAAPSLARADRVVWRMATAAPDSTNWARELHAFARDVETGTDGQVAIKWYFGGVAGDEGEVMQRIGKAQLDGMAAAILCGKVAPSMRVFNVPGIIQGRDEANFLSQKMQHDYATEAQRNGFALLFTSGLGPTLLFTRTPVKTMDELRQIKVWRWNLDEWGVLATREMGLPVYAAALVDATRLYEEGQIGGFTTVPSAALAFQWSTQARYITELPVGYVQGCMLLSNRAWDRLSVHHRDAVMSAAAKCSHRFEEVGRHEEEQLLGGLFERQGLKKVALSTALRAQYFEAARAARERLGDKLLPRALLDQVMRLLADYRAEHGR